LYLRVKLPWTEAFAAVPIICFGFQVGIYNLVATRNRFFL